MAVMEWFIHKYWMHRPFPGLYTTFREHHIEHHSKERNDLNIDLPVTTNWKVSIPICFLIGLFSIQLAIITFIVSTLHAILWTQFHRSFHDVGGFWTRRIPGYNKLLGHHIRHHDRPNRNYGALFGPCIDFIMGTRV